MGERWDEDDDRAAELEAERAKLAAEGVEMRDDFTRYVSVVAGSLVFGVVVLWITVAQVVVWCTGLNPHTELGAWGALLVALLPMVGAAAAVGRPVGHWLWDHGPGHDCDET